MNGKIECCNEADGNIRIDSSSLFDDKFWRFPLEIIYVVFEFFANFGSIKIQDLIKIVSIRIFEKNNSFLNVYDAEKLPAQSAPLIQIICKQKSRKYLICRIGALFEN